MQLLDCRASSHAVCLPESIFANGRSDCRSDPWEYSEKFDYVHTRAISGCWSSFEKEIAQQAFDALEPGGWFESQEWDSIIACDDGTLNPREL